MGQGAPRTCRCIETGLSGLPPLIFSGQGAPRTCRCIETDSSAFGLKIFFTVREHHAPVGALRLRGHPRHDTLVGLSGSTTQGSGVGRGYPWRLQTDRRRITQAGCTVPGRSEPNCTFDRDPLSEDPRNHAETSRCSTPVKSSHAQTGALCTWDSTNERSTIRKNRGIMRETRGQPVRATLSDVQYPHYPERSPRHLESPAPPRSAAWATGPAGSASPAEPPEPVPSTRTWAAVPRLAPELPGSAGDK